MKSEGYAPGWAEDALFMMGQRKADTRAAFVLPFLANGVRVLDVGCGPGTITLGLAEAVAPNGSALGIDMQRSQVELATETTAPAGFATWTPQSRSSCSEQLACFPAYATESARWRWLTATGAAC